MDPYSIAVGFVIGMVTTAGILMYVYWDNRYQGIKVKVNVIKGKE